MTAWMQRWWTDKPLRWLWITALLVRVVPMVLWHDKTCVRDECTYEVIANQMLEGHGMVGSNGWLWAPAYPALMAVHGALTGYPATVQGLQLVASLVTLGLLFSLVEQQAGRRAATLAGWFFALNPTYVFFTVSQWSETFYSALLVGAVLAVGWAREGDHRRGWLPGLLVGVCVLFRGVATYILPIFVLCLLFQRWRTAAAWRGVVACVVAAVLVVAPYSAYATHKFGAFIVSDRTLGQMMWLGNNEFPPVSFDVGDPALARRYERVLRQTGRDHCPYEKVNPVLQDRCELENGKRWIAENPDRFLRRVPERVSQLLHPHSFLTRHLRWGRWEGMPQAMDEALILAVVACSAVVVVGGTLGFVLRASGWYAIASGLILLYHVAAIALVAGLSRYRVPLEPLWLVWAAAAAARPKETLAALDGRSWRGVAALYCAAVVLGFWLWKLPAGWPAWGRW